MLITDENKVILIKRLKSLAWRTGAMVAALLVSQGTDLLGLFNLPQPAVVVLGLILGEIFKHLNNLTLPE